MASTPEPSTLRLRVRVFRGEEPALGPGRIELLERLARSGSIVQAAREMELSYMKAWRLIQSMNRCFRAPLVDLRRGGKDGGSAHLTDIGTQVLGVYQEMDRLAREACQPFQKHFEELFAAPDDK